MVGAVESLEGWVLKLFNDVVQQRTALGMMEVDEVQGEEGELAELERQGRGPVMEI